MASPPCVQRRRRTRPFDEAADANVFELLKAGGRVAGARLVVDVGQVRFGEFAEIRVGEHQPLVSYEASWQTLSPNP